jgi:phage shock protein PspC (stress-responsive transcriptional regulator)
MDRLKQFWRSRSNRWQVFGVTLAALQVYVLQLNLSAETIMLASILFGMGGILPLPNNTSNVREIKGSYYA